MKYRKTIYVIGLNSNPFNCCSAMVIIGILRVDFEQELRMSRRIIIPTDEIEAFCQRNHIRSFGLFGSALREDFGSNSDIDVLVEFEQGQEPDLFRLIELQDELSKMLDREVDLVERRAVEKSENYIRRRHILESVEPIYVAR